ncbi:MAG: type II toxin-antitoxin system HicA family toxin [Candidatus Vogelbacteria bacterium]
MNRLPTLRPKKIIAALKKAGFEEHHQRGSHLYLWQPLTRRMTSVAIHPGDVPRPVFKKILEQADLTEDKFRELL